jgi:hypothetical protein
MVATTLTIRDETTFSGDDDHVFELEVSSEHLTVREIIEARVEAEVARHNARAGERFLGLVRPEPTERFLDGLRKSRSRAIDADEQRRVAIEAFGRNGFLLLVDDRQVMDLDQVIEVRPTTQVTFLKLVPLVGG